MTAPGREVAGRLLRGEVRSPDPEAFGEEALARAEVQREVSHRYRVGRLGARPVTSMGMWT